MCAARSVGSAAGVLNASWTLENDRIAAMYGWYADGWVRLVSLRDKRTDRLWTAAAQSAAGLASLGGAGLFISAQTAYALPTVSQADIARGGSRLTFVFQTVEGNAEIAFEAEVYPGHPFVRQRYRFRNLRTRNQTITSATFLEASFEADRQLFRSFHVDQWVAGGTEGNFEPRETLLGALPEALLVRSGSNSQHCAWVAIADARDNGLVVGWEFNGRAQMALWPDLEADSINLRGNVAALNHTLEPGQVFEGPGVFIGSFRGDWEEAGFRTQRFVEAAVAPPMLDQRRFPYVAWDSWGYQDDINEGLLRRAADVAARLGVELFIVDLGWARAMGDWHGDPVRFPSGMRALSDYVHARGMKFGLHFPLLEADRSAPVLREHPDWTSSSSDGFYNAVSLCPGHEPVKQWLISEAVRMIREYNVDWVLQDGVDMVKLCTKRTHTHGRLNSNYANSVQGFDQILAAIREQTPQTAWENCQSGGRMMTYRMVGSYDTSITADDTDSLTTRQAIYGATYPFPPRFTDRYLSEKVVSKYHFRSAMFGGPLILMQPISEWNDADIRLAAGEVSLYKALRLLIRDGKVFHLTPRPDGLRNEALQSVNARINRSVIFVFRTRSAQDSETVKPRGLSPNTEYQVRLQEAGTIMVATGRDLMERGLEVPLPSEHFAEIIRLTPQPAAQ